jgi:hypothetical protein
MKTLTVEMDTDGTIKIDAAGFQGQGCEKAVKAIQAALSSAPPKDGARKPEFRQVTTNGQTQGA